METETNLKIEYIPLEQLTPYEKNARKHQKKDLDVIKASILEFGMCDPIGVWGKKNIIVEGHGRYLVLKELGWEKAPCLRLDHLTDEQRKAYALTHNRSAELSSWDFDFLDEELKDLEDEFNLIELGFEDLLTDNFEEQNLEPHDDDFNEDDYIQEEAHAKVGDIFKLGRHTLMCGDSLNESDVKTLINDEQIELMFTDPPYELETRGGGILKYAKSMQEIEENNVNHFDPLKLNPFCKTNIFFHNKALIKDYILLAEKYKMPYDLAIYKKSNVAPNYNSHLMTDIEYIAIIGNLDPNKGFEKQMYSKCWEGMKDENNDLSYSKPIALCSKFISLYSENKVLDLFGGSGSTLIACEQLNKICYMMELDPKYVDVIVKRYIKYMGSADNCYLNGEPIPDFYKEGVLE